MNAKTWACVALATAIAAVTNCAIAQTWSGAGDKTWTQPDSNDFSPDYTSGSTATFTTTGAGTVTVDAGGVKEKVGILKLLRISATEPQPEGIWGATGNTAAQYTCAELLGTGLLYVNVDPPASGTLIYFQ